MYEVRYFFTMHPFKIPIIINRWSYTVSNCNTVQNYFAVLKHKAFFGVLVAKYNERANFNSFLIF